MHLSSDRGASSYPENYANKKLKTLRKADGQYALNGNWAINWSGDYEAAGTVFSFKRQDTVAGEVITASGPLQEPIDIMVLYQQPNPGIKYEYMLPMSSDAALLGAMIPPVVPSVTRPGALNSVIAPPLLLPGGVGKIPVETPVVKDGTVQDSPDSRSPTFPYGSGVLGTDSRPAVITYHQTAGEARPVIGTHSNHQGPAEEPHKPIGKSKSRKRKFAWKLAGFTECTKTCGGGLSTTMVVCVREHSQITVPERRCGYQEKPHPQTIRCNNKPCPAEWVPGEWGECSVTCGDGVQTRDMICKQEITPTLTMKVAEGACLKPPSQSRTQACQRPECPTQGPPQEWTRRTRWETGQWGQCSVPCGQGKRSRMVKCIGVNNSEQEDCLQNDQPAQEEECNLSPCPNSTAQYPWMYTEWTQQCSEECGTGVQTRRVHCSVDLHCDLGLRPDDTRACSSDKQCSGKWFAGPWGQCSPGCGQGHQTRDVVCVAFIRGQHHVALYMNCPENLKPDTDRVCESNPCAPDWFITEWGQCSRECGTGVQKREVKCLDDKQQLSSGCAEDARPPSRRVCNTHDCSTGSATEKSSSHPLSRIDDDPSLSNGAGDQALPDETLHKDSVGEVMDEEEEEDKSW
uniref:ADAMTS/ADAMTS-like Spacer 1 domain-containing protein n=1 Tax=Timema monikensis TaxID=170555 RepID=A0A7R9E045_9NEOP|nr:unnamed protein product [Timema monikensis]